MLDDVLTDTAQDTPAENTQSAGTHHHLIPAVPIHTEDDEFTRGSGILGVHAARNLEQKCKNT